MNTKQKLGYIVVGGALVAVGMAVAVLLVSPVTAQNDKIDTIQCSRLVVVDAGGTPRVTLSANAKDYADYSLPNNGGILIVANEDGGRVDISSSLESVRLGADGLQASLAIVNDEKYLVRMASDGINGGELTVNNKVKIGYDLHVDGGYIRVDGGEGEGSALIHIDKYGDGAVSTTNKNGYRR